MVGQMSFFIICGTNVTVGQMTYVIIGGTNVKVGRMSGGTNVGGTCVGGTKVAPPKKTFQFVCKKMIDIFKFLR